jgi:glucosamine--fructose-6-phosphate aminotransferase (isomerizing)
MLDEVLSLPGLLSEGVKEAAEVVGQLPRGLLRCVRRLVVTGSGDSYFAGIATRLAVETIAGVVAEPMTSLYVSRFGAESLAAGGPAGTLVVGISVSGSTARTVESLAIARAAGAPTVGLTMREGSRLAEVAEHVLLVQGTPWVDPEPTTTPGVRSWALNLVTLLLLGAEIGAVQGRVAGSAGSRLWETMDGLASRCEQTIDASLQPALRLVEDTVDIADYDVLGGGPNLGTAHFSAAKLIEASGDRATGQDIEEWAHLQFYTRANDVGTVVITAADRDLFRSAEVLRAAGTIGRPTICVLPDDRADRVEADAVLPFASGVEEPCTPLLAAIPIEIFAACRAQRLGETYFRQDRPVSVSRIREPVPLLPGTSLPS